MTKTARRVSRPLRLQRRAAALLHEIDVHLKDSYPNGERRLGNRADPLDEAIFIILTFQTDIPRARQTWRILRRRYSTWAAVDAASTAALADCLLLGGLQNQKARTIQALLRAVRRRFGTLSLSGLRSLPMEEAERELTKLPGLSWKGARCVLLYSLKHQTFPVDGNTFRIMRRVGVLPQATVYRRRSVHDALQAAVPPGRRRRLHVSLVLHGQDVCLPRGPVCELCPLRSCCRTALAEERRYEPGRRSGADA